MNCHRCGEECEPVGYICQTCLDDVSAPGKTELSPEEAVLAMLNGETLITAKGNKVIWSDEDGMFVFIESLSHLACFKNLCRIVKPETRPMDTIECLAWVNSPVSYRRARILPDKSGIDESSIQGFLKEVSSEN